MLPIRYDDHCAGCHTLALPDQLAYRSQHPGDPSAIITNNHRRDTTALVSHDDPTAVRMNLRGRLAELAAQSDAALDANRTPSTLRPPGLTGDEPPQEETRVITEWIESRITEIENRLYKRENQFCLKCHTVVTSENADDPPRIHSTGIREHWFTGSRFDHTKHDAIPVDPRSPQGQASPGDLACIVCHQQATTSRLTADLLLPGIDTCRTCHGPPTTNHGELTGGVSDQCTTCHTFHLPPIPAKSPARNITREVANR
jgi:hypothetical protein